MNAAMIADVATMLLCAAVLVQCARLMRSLQQLRKAGLRETVEALERATGEARSVLGNLKQFLATDMGECGEIVAEGVAMRDELTVMIGIGNAVAERIVEAAAVGKRGGSQGEPVQEAMS